MPQQFDLVAYLARINYKGPLAPTYDTLVGILPAHIASIPFESFDVLLGRPIRLDPEGRFPLKSRPCTDIMALE